MIRIDHIRVVNPRLRNKVKFKEILENIKAIGLKRPITVRVGEVRDGVQYYDLTCGQGRLESYIHYEQKMIPAVITQDSKHKSLAKGVIENMARTRYTAREQFGEIRTLKGRGYSYAEIAKKVDIDPEIARGVCLLLENGEDKLLNAVVAEKIPMYVAIHIAQLKDGEIQSAISDLYTQGKLTGKKVEYVIKFIQNRKIAGKGFAKLPGGKRGKVTAASIEAEFNREMERQHVEYQQLQLHEHNLRVIERLTQDLLKDEHFVTLLRAEKLNHLPETLAKAAGQHG
jgi:ParB family chromosome partitioning protein